MSLYQNPFIPEDDRNSLWEMLVKRDIKAFVSQDWSMVQQDFIEEGFVGIDGRHLGNPDSWRLNFPTLSVYKQLWLEQAKDFAMTEWTTNPEIALYEATTLRDIEVMGNTALLHKKFDGEIVKKSGETIQLNWQTLYTCRKINGSWKIAGFTGYLPHPMGTTSSEKPAKQQPKNTSQHVTAGPYSPVLQINPGQIIVISGQAAIDKSGAIIGETIEEQTELTLENCKAQLESGGASMNDAFKVNVYLQDLDDWPRFNEVYKKYFKDPLPVRTAVQAGLLGTLMVEVEIWAVKK